MDIILVKIAHQSRRKEIEPQPHQKLCEACNNFTFEDTFNPIFLLKIFEIAAQPGSQKKRKAFGLSYLIDENPPWHICLLLGFQVKASQISNFFPFEF